MKTTLTTILMATLLMAGTSSCDTGTKYKRLDPAALDRGKSEVEPDNSDTYEEPYHAEPERREQPSTATTTTTAPSTQAPANSNQTNNMVACPGCGGTGVFRFGNDFNAPMAVCPGCNGSGMVTAALAVELMKLQQNINQNMGTSMGGGGYGGGSSSGTMCANCHGNGRCTFCGGRGERRYEGNYGYSGGVMECSQCHGSGRCPYCHGRGSI